MEFKVSQEDFVRGVQGVERIVATRSTLPVIGNILFEATKGGLKLSANNLEMGMEVIVPAKVSKEGSILVPAKTLGGVVSRLPAGEVKIKASEKGIIKICYGESTFSIHGSPPDEFPVLPKVKEGKEIKIDAKSFLKMVKQTIFAASQSEDKHVLNGVLFEVGKPKSGEKSSLRMIATDGYRLARRGENIGQLPGEDVAAIIPAKALIEVSRLLSQTDADGKVEISVAADQVAFRFQDAYLISRVIQGQFPDYHQVLPKKSEAKITVSTKELQSAAERAAIIASGSANVIKFELREKKLYITSSAPDIGSIEEVLEVEGGGGGKTQIAFNVRLVVDALKVMDTQKVMLELSGALSPGVLRPVGEADYIYIVMPIRTAEAG